MTSEQSSFDTIWRSVIRDGLAKLTGHGLLSPGLRAFDRQIGKDPAPLQSRRHRHSKDREHWCLWDCRSRNLEANEAFLSFWSSQVFEVLKIALVTG